MARGRGLEQRWADVEARKLLDEMNGLAALEKQNRECQQREEARRAMEQQKYFEPDPFAYQREMEEMIKRERDAQELRKRWEAESRDPKEWAWDAADMKWVRRRDGQRLKNMPEIPEYTTELGTASTLTTVSTTAHKAGHFPIQWMIEGHERASQSSALIRIELEVEGVMVVGIEGDNYQTHKLPWTMMDKAQENPLIPAIEHVERSLATLDSLKAMVG